MVDLTNFFFNESEFFLFPQRAQCVEFTKFLYHLKLFREINFTVKLYTKEVVFTEIFQKIVIQKFSKLHSVESDLGTKNLHIKNISSNQYICSINSF